MKDKKDQDDFMTDYLEWLEHKDNPYYYAGSISNFSLRAWSKKKRYKRSEGLPYFLGGFLLLLLMIFISWSMISNENEYLILFVSVPFSIFSLIMAWRGLTIIFGIAPDMISNDEPFE